MQDGEPLKRCGCGVRYTAEQWQELPLIGEQASEDATGKYVVEMRNCRRCKSTLGIERRQQSNPAVQRG